MNKIATLPRDVILLIGALGALTAKAELIPDPAWLQDELIAVRKKYELPAMTPNMATITDGFVIGMLMCGGISLCVSGFSKKGLPLNSSKRITGRPAKIVGIISLILSLVAAAFWAGLRGVIG